MSHEKLLLVEGIDDLHAVRNLVYQHDVSVYYEAEKEPSVEACDLEIRQAGGRDRLGTAITDVLRLENVTTLGVIADADDSHETCWESIINYFFQHVGGRSFTRIQELDAQDGWIGESLDRAGDPVRVGSWVMPDNTSEGAFEDFAASLVPDDDNLWPHAGSVISTLPRRPFKPVHEGKARMHTYLAWQDPPREPIGRSISNGPLNATSPLAERFVGWVRRLFEIDVASGAS